MAIERFTKAEFEKALPVHKDTGRLLWASVGLVDGEFTYTIFIREGVKILVRSSVGENGLSRSKGKDSIRAWLVNDEGGPLGSKVQAYVTRERGWNKRLIRILRELWKRGYNLEQCPDCGEMMGVYKVRKEGENKGKLFTKCWKHDHFAWIGDDGKPIAVQEKKGETLYIEQEKGRRLLVRELGEVGTVKRKVTMIKNLIKVSRPWRYWVLLFIYSQQTIEEQEARATIKLNGVGFTGVDAEILTSFAFQHKEHGRLSDRQEEILKEKLPKYAAQIERLLRDN